jgi:cytochrome P450
VSETLRLYPPAFAVARKAIGRDEVDGVVIPPGSLAMISPWVLHRHVRLWEEPEAFNPARFLGDEQPAHRFAYLPFGAGPRVCVGAQFALTEASMVLAMLTQRFEIGLAGTTPVLPVAVITTQPDHPAPFRLTPRS